MGGVLDCNAENVSGELAFNFSFSVPQDDITQKTKTKTKPQLKYSFIDYS